MTFLGVLAIIDKNTLPIQRELLMPEELQSTSTGDITPNGNQELPTNPL
ncbi:MAG: hypothetical protein LBH96_06345 [Candidatus Peribacteria bacterium]|nr:hypothetical protein [Candidatus Peribacteria bacterium]